MKSKFFIFLLGLFIIPSVIAWGEEAHYVIGYIGQNLLNPEVAKYIEGLIQDPVYEGKLTKLCQWADTVAHDSPAGPAKYPWSEPLHFLVTHADPPEKCEIDYGLDCPNDACVVGAIVNYTRRLDCKSGFDATQRDEALRFVTHFIGDVTQPLHVCGKKGGTQTRVNYNKKKKIRLHIVWDIMLVLKRIVKEHNDDFKQFGDYLLDKIRNEYASEVDSWYTCDVNDLPNLIRCVLPWAIESNAINCEFAWHYGDGEWLNGRYFDQSKPIVDKLLAKAGYRMARLLNELLTKEGC